MSGILIAFLFMLAIMLATVALTAFLCRYRVKHHKPVGVGITLACGSAFPFLFYLIILSVSWGSTKKWDPFIALGVCSFITSLCIVPALGIVAYYQKRSPQNDDHAA
jgi:uncharacterized BrkB/YihY/UPF0761 family membrane protein